MDQNVILILFQVFALVLAFSVHECAHAWVAWRLGDPTARMLGRVTLNPLKHLDLFGSVLMPLIALVYHWPLIGWAKPTPVTARNFKNYKRDDILVTLAGPSDAVSSGAAAVFHHPDQSAAVCLQPGAVSSAGRKPHPAPFSSVQSAAAL
jgi:Zn-dependent protease